MLRNFQLAAITKNGNDTVLYRIPLHQELQDALAERWSNLLDEFTTDVREIEFNAGYTPEDDERFRIAGYVLPDWLQNETSMTAPNLDVIDKTDDLIGTIKGLVAFATNDAGEEVMLFQNFSSSHIIQPGRFLFLQNDTYETAQRPALALDGKLSALYSSNSGVLLFYNFRTTNSFIPLADFYEDASEQEIYAVLGHPLLAAENAEALAIDASHWFRKRFAMLRDSEILDNHSALEIQDRSENFAVDVQLDAENRIVFPEDKVEAKRLLQFLNEEIFRGAITNSLYETNSKRETDG